MYPCIHETSAGVVLQVQVQPRASRNQLVGLQGTALKIRLTSPPVDGAANKACCEYLAKTFGIAKGAVELVAGGKSRQKRVLLKGLDRQTVSDILQSRLDVTP
ncbi:MAG: YggU family protein [Deltaproteobacteria bacterium]|nr:YggU family protein [Deltaproteobacteria bacterium]